MPTNFNRKKNRLPFKSLYAGNNWYFATICVQERVCILDIVGAGFIRPLNNRGVDVAISPRTKSVLEVFQSLPQFFGNIILDEFVIMPNHVHFVIGFDGNPVRLSNNKNVDLSEIVRTFKALSTKKFNDFGRILQNRRINPAPTNYIQLQWQKSFYDHVIRDEKDLQRIREYIYSNPLQWQIDILNPKNDDKYKSWLVAKNDKLSLS